jgi:hypothetical protein
MFRAAAWITIALSLGVSLGLAQEEDEAAKKARLKKLDAGPRKIDVTKYPEKMQADYALFSKKCVKCHTLARPINSPYVLPSQWERYIRRMVYKPDSKMTEEDGRNIFQFLVYDASVRKADSLRAHLATLPAEDRAAEVERIKALNPAFQPAGK